MSIRSGTDVPSVVTDEPAGFNADARDTAPARVLIGLVSLLALLGGLLGLLVDLPGVRVAGLLVFSCAGIGAAPWQLNPWLRLPGRLTLSILTSFTTLLLVSSAMILVPIWTPVVAMVLVCLVVVPLHIAGLGRAWSDLGRTEEAEAEAEAEGNQLQEIHGTEDWSWELPSSPTSPPTDSALPLPALRSSVQGQLLSWCRPRLQLLATALGTVLCLATALTHRHLEPEFGGFPWQVSPLWIIGLGVIVAALALGRGEDEAQMAASAVALMVVLTLTPALIYDGPRSQSAAKHVDLVNQIRTLHVLESPLGVYNSWPGFFSATAWLCDVAGIGNAMTLARYWPALIGLFRLVALRYLFGKLLRTPYQAWVAVGIAILADPTGADYFSPQSLGFSLGLAVFALALARARSLIRVWTILAAGCALAVTHQLSPYMVAGALVVLVAFRQISPWWTPLLVLSPAVTWLTIHLSDVSMFLYVSDFGDASNFRPPQTATSTGLDRLPIISQTVGAFALLLVIIGLLALVTLWLELGPRWLPRLARLSLHPREKRAFAMALVPTVGLAVVAVNPYGQEGIFRAVLFAIPWLVALAAHRFSRADRLVQRLPLLALLLVLAPLFLVTAFGLDRTSVIRNGDLGAFRYFGERESSPPGTPQILLTLGKGDLPTPAGRAGDSRHHRISRDALKIPVQEEVDYDPVLQVEEISRKLRAYTAPFGTDADLYVLWSPTSSAYGWAYGIQSPEQFTQLRDAFSASRDWRPAFEQDGTIIFRYEGS